VADGDVASLRVNAKGEPIVQLSGSTVADAQAIPERKKAGVETKGSNLTVTAGATANIVILTNGLSLDKVTIMSIENASAAHNNTLVINEQSSDTLTGNIKVTTNAAATAVNILTITVTLPRLVCRITNGDAVDHVYQNWYIQNYTEKCGR